MEGTCVLSRGLVYLCETVDGTCARRSEDATSSSLASCLTALGRCPVRLWVWQREVELAGKMKEENKWLRVAYKDALAKAERAMAAAAKETGRADEVEKALRLRDQELEQLQGRLKSLQEMYNT